MLGWTTWIRTGPLDHDADDLLLVQRAAAGDGRFVHLAKDQGRAARSLDGEDSVGFAAAAASGKRVWSLDLLCSFFAWG